MIKQFIAVAALATLVTGCASVPMGNTTQDTQLKSFPEPDAGNAGIYVYRNSVMGSGLKKDLWIDDQCLGESASGIYFYKQVLGNQNHKVSTESEFSPNDLMVTTEAGKNYFIRQYIKPGMFVGGANLELMSEQEGEKAVAKLKLAESGHCSK
ncbi:DUF2846 domain-containing protein [Pokkaliibacter sp. CJK22405]|uniref:DUF2846 domain-containing protein n=1 Tax=Pokkaliibacter sp. CJK22405 TaxID=3384615 RepID=UPI003984BD09